MPADRTRQWLRLADEDLRMARLARGEQIWNQVCFHAQQAAEKSLKAFLERSGGLAPKIHSLAELLALARREDGSFGELETLCLQLDRFYIPTRYPSALVGSLPGGYPSEDDGREALDAGESIHRFTVRRLAP